MPLESLLNWLIFELLGFSWFESTSISNRGTARISRYRLLGGSPVFLSLQMILGLLCKGRRRKFNQGNALPEAFVPRGGNLSGDMLLKTPDGIVRGANVVSSVFFRLEDVDVAIHGRKWCSQQESNLQPPDS